MGYSEGGIGRRDRERKRDRLFRRRGVNLIDCCRRGCVSRKSYQWATRPPLQLMRKINLNDIEEEAWQSPGGKYAANFKGISEALGRDPNSLDLAKRHPFDLELTRVPPGKRNFPYHAHSAQWELYLVIVGKGSLRHENA